MKTRTRKGVNQAPHLDEKEIVRLYIEDKLNINEIAKMLNVNFATIKKRLVRNNVKLRSYSESKFIKMNKPEVKAKIVEANKRSAAQRMATNIERYGSAVASNNKEKREEWEKKYLKEHGVEWNKDPNRLEKSKNTNMERYGVENGAQSQEAKDKIKQNRWENKTEEELQEIKNKTIETWQETLGCDNPLKNEDIKNKFRESRWENKTEEELQEIQEKVYKTNLERYGCEISTQSAVVKQKLINTLKNKFLTQTLPDILKRLNLIIHENWENAHTKYTFSCIKCDGQFSQTWNEVQQGYICPKCYPRTHGTSLGEKDLLNYIQSILPGVKIISNDRSVLSPKELDIYIPSLNIAIEYNGLFYHSENSPGNVDKYYHLNKTNQCSEKGIKLIHIFEDEWVFKQDIVKARLSQILKVSNAQRIHARKCTIKEIESNIKNEFLDKYHLQGKDNSVIKLGAFYNDELISVMTFAKGNIAKGSKFVEGEWELNRFCSNYNYHIPGIASKLLKYFKNNYKWDKIFSYADRRWSVGNLYSKLGFEDAGITKINYWYVKGIQRLHRFNLRKKANEPDNMPEWVLRREEGYYKIWDCGNLKYIMINENGKK